MHNDENPPSLLGLIMPKGVTTDKEDIGRLILESLDAVLDETLGKPMRQAFYDLLERNYYMSRDDIPRRLGDFMLILERNFGKNGKTIRRDIAQRLTQELGARRH